MGKSETYPAAPARIGNSRGFRVDAALFQAHPELREGNFEAAYIGSGVLLVRQRRKPTRTRANPDGEKDPVIAAYLAWTEQTMENQPGLIRQMSQREFDIAEALVAGVDVDLERDRLPDDFELP